MMGSPNGGGGINGSVSEPGRYSNEALHEVELTSAFYMARTTVTPRFAN